MYRRRFTVGMAFLVGFVLSSAIWWSTRSEGVAQLNVIAAAEEAAQQPVDVAALKAEVERLKGVVPDQAHAMADVEHHFAHLWFAGKAGNWPLAEFYWKETLSHIRWAVRIIPIRKDNTGREVKLEAILQAIENTPRLKMGDVISQHDPSKFESTYRQFLDEACYTCHKASDKPYLRPQIPQSPGSSMINFDPKATWPK